MTSSGQKVGRSQRMAVAAVIGGVLLLGGCGDILGEKSTGAKVQNIISDMSRIETVTEPNIPIPEVYKAPPQFLETKDGVMLLYFAQYHSVDEFAGTEVVSGKNLVKVPGLIEEQFANCKASKNPATNQLIIRCPTREEADVVLKFLRQVDVPPIQVKIDCIISEIYADKTLDWQTTILIEELFGEGIWAGPAAQRFGTTVSDLLTEGDVLPAFPGASLRELARGKMGLKMGYSTKKYLTLIDILESQGYLKILMNPTLTTINGKPAMVSSLQHVPLQQTYMRSPLADWVETKIEYEDVIDSLEITPHVFADGIGLETNIVLGSKLTPEGVKQLPIITKKEIENKENRIRLGESLIIGGIRKSEKRDVVRGIPLLKDIPILGVLFSGKDLEERVVETIFILTPTISTGGIPNEEIIKEVRRKHEGPSPEEAKEEAEVESRN